jgi:hypothetical protein
MYPSSAENSDLLNVGVLDEFWGLLLDWLESSVKAIERYVWEICPVLRRNMKAGQLRLIISLELKTGL